MKVLLKKGIIEERRLRWSNKPVLQHILTLWLLSVVSRAVLQRLSTTAPELGSVQSSGYSYPNHVPQSLLLLV